MNLPGRRFISLSLMVSFSACAAVIENPPQIARPNAAEKTVEGTSKEAQFHVRIKVTDADGKEAQHSDAWVDPKDHTFIAGLRKPLIAGQVVQAFLMIGNVERFPSNPVTVDGPITKPVAHPPDPECVVQRASGWMPPAIDAITSDGAEIKGTYSLSAGTVSVCVNGSRVKVKDSPTGAPSDSVAFKNGKYDVFLSDAISAQDQILIALQSDDKEFRVTTDNVSVSSLPKNLDSADAAAASSKKNAKNVPAQQQATTDNGSPNDGNQPPKKDETADSTPVSSVQLTSKPKEGQDTLYVNSSPAPDASVQSLAVYVDGEPVRLLNSSGDGAGAVPVDTTGKDGNTAIRLERPLNGGQCVRVVEFETGKRPQVSPEDLICPAESDETVATLTGVDAQGNSYALSIPTITSAFFNYGRIRSYLAAGTLFSYDGGSFSQPSVFLSLSAYRNWKWGGVQACVAGTKGCKKGTDNQMVEHLRRWMFDTFFEARLTTIPVPACPTGSTPTNTGCSGQTSGGVSQTSLQPVLASPKAGEVLAGATIPVILATWNTGGTNYGFSLGPIAKVGFITPVGSQGTTQAITPQPFYTNFGFGTRFGFHKLTHSPDVSPELLSYVDVLTGRYSNFDYNPNPSLRYARPWRFAFEGLLNVPTTPLYLGFSANIHQNFGLNNSHTVDQEKDDLRFFFGTKIDAGKLFDAIGKIQ